MSKPKPVEDVTVGLGRHPIEEQVRVLEAVAALSSEAIVLSASDDLDPVLRVHFVNDAFTRLLGWDLEYLTGESPGVLVGPETDLDTLRRIEAGLRNGETVSVELRLHHRDGEAVRVAATYRALPSGTGVTWSLATYVDLSDRVEAAAALHRSEVWAEAMVQGSSDLVMVADPDGVVRYASPAVTEVLGYRPEEFVGRSFLEMIHADDAHRSRGLLDSGGRARPGRPYEFRLGHREGGWRTVGVRIADRVDDPAVRGFVVNIRDVSARRRAEDLLAEQADLLEAIARGAPLEVTLAKITAMVERNLDAVTAVVGVIDDDGVIRVRSGSGLPAEVIEFYDDLPPDSLAGEAMRSGVGEVFVFDLVDDARLGDARELFATHGFTQARAATLR
ncbi:MAG TPA: PAS domain-containing protein, partial [Acidimicrobiales bacterium]